MSQQIPDESAESAFWKAFAYDHGKDRWMLAERLSPIDLIPIVKAKISADQAWIDQAAGPSAE